jgi:hypothetical protein
MYKSSESPFILKDMGNIPGALPRYKEWRTWVKNEMKRKTLKKGYEVSPEMLATEVAVTLYQNLVTSGVYMHMAKEARHTFGRENSTSFDYRQAAMLENYWGTYAQETGFNVYSMIERTLDIKKKADELRENKSQSLTDHVLSPPER